jgi:serine/threonine-protein kinase
LSDAAPEGKPANFSILPAERLIGGRYRVETVIGEGAQGVVYLARREQEDDRVALKVIHRHLSGDPQIFKRFHREARILSRLEGEHIVKLLDFIEEDGLLIIALEHVEGRSLEAMLEERAPIDVDQAIEITIQVCAALGVAHANGIVHRDLKPANVLIERPAASRSGSAAALRVKVVDFGLAKVLQGEQMSTGLTQQGMIFGTPEYMAPEQARGEDADPRSDLYTAGVMLYQMAVGRVPFSGRTPLDTMTAHVSEAAPSPRAARPGSGITPSLEAAILRALAKDPADRYASAREFAEAIAAVRDEPLVVAPRQVSNIDDFVTGDTDLNVGRPSLEQAKTLRPDEVASLKAADKAAPMVIEVRRTEVPATKPSPGAPRPRPFAEGIMDEPTAVSGAPPRRSWIWAIVAIVAAAVGVVIGAIVGTR